MATFAQGSKVPPVKHVLKAAGIKYKEFLKFDNGALVDPSHGDDALNKQIWQKAAESYNSFFRSLDDVPRTKLELTKEVLDERNRLHETILELQRKRRERIAKVDELDQERQILKEREADILLCKDFTYEIEISKQRRVDIAGTGIYVTNCLNCNYTCHNDCLYSNNGDKYKCTIMDYNVWEPTDRNKISCKICPQKCNWRVHHNDTIRLEHYTEIEKRTSKDLKIKYDEATDAKQVIQDTIRSKQKEMDDIKDSIIEDIKTINKSLNRLDEIALTRSHMTDIEYINTLIQTEERKGETEGRDKRTIKFLYDIREQVTLLQSIKKDAPIL